MEQDILVGVAAAPFITALVSILVKPFIADVRAYPISAVALGIGYEAITKASDIAAQGDLTWGAVVILGAVVGMVASGAYSVTKAGDRVASSSGSP